jgi:hypothetical protein
MFAIINDNNERLANAYTFKFVDDSKRCCLWKNEAPALRLIEKLKNENLGTLRVIEVSEIPVPGKRRRKSKEETKVQEENIEFDETSFFESGYNEKCLRCEGDCKQSALAKIIRCPSFRKIKK